MSNELKLPSHIYQEISNTPIISNKIVTSTDTANNLKVDMLSDYLSEYLLALDKKVNMCLINQINIVKLLEKIDTKLQEFE